MIVNIIKNILRFNNVKSKDVILGSKIEEIGFQKTSENEVFERLDNLELLKRKKYNGTFILTISNLKFSENNIEITADQVIVIFRKNYKTDKIEILSQDFGIVTFPSGNIKDIEKILSNIGEIVHVSLQLLFDILIYPKGILITEDETIQLDPNNMNENEFIILNVDLEGTEKIKITKKNKILIIQPIKK